MIVLLKIIQRHYGTKAEEEIQISNNPTAGYKISIIMIALSICIKQRKIKPDRDQIATHLYRLKC